LGPPVITQQPIPAYQEALQGGVITLTVAATGTQPLSYKWRRNNITVLNQTNALLRITNAASGNAGNFTVLITNLAGAITSAVAVVVYQADNDRDGMADNWERQYGFATNTVADASEDPDGDSMSNLAEYRAGTNPTNALSCLRIDNLSVSEGRATIQFFAVSNRTYTVQFTDQLDTGGWRNLTGIPAAGTNRHETATDPAAVTNRFYHLVTPAQP
jgi:hypothetical protein